MIEQNSLIKCVCVFVCWDEWVVVPTNKEANLL